MAHEVGPRHLELVAAYVAGCAAHVAQHVVGVVALQVAVVIAAVVVAGVAGVEAQGARDEAIDLREGVVLEAKVGEDVAEVLAISDNLLEIGLAEMCKDLHEADKTAGDPDQNSEDKDETSH